MMCIPEAWQNDPNMEDYKKDFYRFHSVCFCSRAGVALEIVCMIALCFFMRRRMRGPLPSGAQQRELRLSLL